MLDFPNAKLNIGLFITEKRADGFHNLESCFYPVKWCDALEMLPAEQERFTVSGLPVPGNPESNLCLKAYKLLQERFELPPVHIHLHKIIPMGAGLGGGSSDASYTLKGLNSLFSLNLSTLELEGFARQLGSDCAFFIQNKPVLAVEKGDVFRPIHLDLKGYSCIVVYPGLHITTAEAYGKVVPKAPVSSLAELLQQDISEWKTTVKNDFEEALFPRYPVLADIKRTLYGAGAAYASMTGSGSAVFGLFKGEAPASLVFPGEYLLWKGLL